MSKVVGIDLGTTNSLVAYVKDGVPVVVRERSGDALVPSIVSAAEDGTIYVGREAQRRLLTDASRTVYSVKRFMGKAIDDVHDDRRLFPFRMTGGPSSPGGAQARIVRIGLGEREFTPPELSALILRELKHRAEAPVADEGDVCPDLDRARRAGRATATPRGHTGAVGVRPLTGAAPPGRVRGPSHPPRRPPSQSSRPFLGRQPAPPWPLARSGGGRADAWSVGVWTRTRPCS